MPIVIQNIDRYVLLFKDGDLIIEDKIIHPKDRSNHKEKQNIALTIEKEV